MEKQEKREPRFSESVKQGAGFALGIFFFSAVILFALSAFFGVSLFGLFASSTATAPSAQQASWAYDYVAWLQKFVFGNPYALSALIFLGLFIIALILRPKKEAPSPNLGMTTHAKNQFAILAENIK